MTKASVSVAICSLWLLSLAPAHAQKPGGDPASKAMKNPVPATAASIAAGKAAYAKRCSHCHGARGAGDGRFAPKDPPPPDLTDAKWDRGSSEADIFLVIWNGPSEDAKMRPLKGTVAEREVWNIVNYVRTLSQNAAAP